jgi:hypothetical protein
MSEYKLGDLVQVGSGEPEDAYRIVRLYEDEGRALVSRVDPYDGRLDLPQNLRLTDISPYSGASNGWPLVYDWNDAMEEGDDLSVPFNDGQTKFHKLDPVTPKQDSGFVFTALSDRNVVVANGKTVNGKTFYRLGLAGPDNPHPKSADELPLFEDWVPEDWLLPTDNPRIKGGA